MANMISIVALKIQNPIEAPFRALAQWRRRLQTQRALSKLSAHELNDIGIEFADIKATAKRAIA